MPTHYHGTPEERRALDAFIKLMRATDSVSADLTRHVGEADLTLGQFGVLESLLHLGPMCLGALGAKLLRSGSNLTTVVGNLEKRGLVVRTPRATDRRVIDVDLTPKGRKLITGLFPAHARRITQLFSSLSATEQKRLGDLCRTLGRSLSHTTTGDDT
jgi:MarR family 2-MHQ and catechol resistance regulon transcriptional repressor